MNQQRLAIKMLKGMHGWYALTPGKIRTCSKSGQCMVGGHDEVYHAKSLIFGGSRAPYRSQLSTNPCKNTLWGSRINVRQISLNRDVPSKSKYFRRTAVNKCKEFSATPKNQ
jgi:hypothetical protein